MTGSFDGSVLWWDVMRGCVSRRVDMNSSYAIRGLHFDPTKFVTGKVLVSFRYLNAFVSE